MDEYLVSKSFNAKPSQAKLDSAVVNMIISANLPFTFVREQSFKDLITLCQPGMKVLSYETLIRKMECQVNEMHENTDFRIVFPAAHNCQVVHEMNE